MHKHMTSRQTETLWRATMSIAKKLLLYVLFIIKNITYKVWQSKKETLDDREQA